jgi:hypothetical protein
MMGIVDATDSDSPPSSILWHRFPAAAELRAVDRAPLISTESDGFLQFVCQSCTAQKSLIPTLPAKTDATILKEAGDPVLGSSFASAREVKFPGHWRRA